MVMFEQFCLRGDARTSLENAYANEKTRHVSDLTGMCFKMEADLNTGAAVLFYSTVVPRFPSFHFRAQSQVRGALGTRGRLVIG